MFVNPPAITMDVRLGWELGVIEQPRNHLIIEVQVGTGTAVTFPLGIRAIYQHVAMLGFGYRSTREVFHWGFSVMTGPLWYRAAYNPGVPFRFESRVVTYSEATVQFGFKAAAHLIVGVYGGYGAPWDVSNRFPATIYTGGPTFGLFADWR
jgi:hypothetical protein